MTAAGCVSRGRFVGLSWVVDEAQLSRREDCVRLRWVLLEELFRGCEALLWASRSLDALDGRPRLRLGGSGAWVKVS